MQLYDLIEMSDNTESGHTQQQRQTTMFLLSHQHSILIFSTTSDFPWNSSRYKERHTESRTRTHEEPKFAVQSWEKHCLIPHVISLCISWYICVCVFLCDKKQTKINDRSISAAQIKRNRQVKKCVRSFLMISWTETPVVTQPVTVC